MKKGRYPKSLILISIVLLAAGFAAAQDKPRSNTSLSNAVLWEPVNIAERDLYLGPGGEEMKPDLSKVVFVEEEKQGHNKKYRIKDAKGQVWVAKFGSEAQPETAAVRILYGIGYKTEINYLVPSLTIPGKGTFDNVRLEARPENAKRLDEWKWKENPFVGTNELQGLKIMMVFFTNWDLLDLQNKVVRVSDNGEVEHQYIISDLGATFGKLGNNNLPFFFRLGRKTNQPDTWNEAGFVSGVKEGKIDFDFKGKGRGLMDDITIAQGRWLADLLLQLSDKQIEDAFRAAGYGDADVVTLKDGFKDRVSVLDRATKQSPAAALGQNREQ
ncbi:MAG TPA: hypothetical protein VHL50_04000 [Pyrinomonadaceae bacterium]|jgi:hypothetical protein|nr:hypothetical protein [Pyrinomonadaceae bacterium]